MFSVIQQWDNQTFCSGWIYLPHVLKLNLSISQDDQWVCFKEKNLKPDQDPDPRWAAAPLQAFCPPAQLVSAAAISGAAEAFSVMEEQKQLCLCLQLHAHMQFLHLQTCNRFHIRPTHALTHTDDTHYFQLSKQVKCGWKFMSGKVSWKHTHTRTHTHTHTQTLQSICITLSLTIVTAFILKNEKKTSLKTVSTLSPDDPVTTKIFSSVFSLYFTEDLIVWGLVEFIKMLHAL